MNRAEVRHHLLHVMMACKTVAESRAYLLPLGRIFDFSLVESRTLWYGVLLYQFPTEMCPSSEVYAAARDWIRQSLRIGGADTGTARTLLLCMEEWLKHT